MTAVEATAKVFITAFKALRKSEREAVLASFVKDRELREDLLDLAIAEARSKQKGRPFRDFLAKLDREDSR